MGAIDILTAIQSSNSTHVLPLVLLPAESERYLLCDWSAAELAAARRALIAVIDEIGKEIVLDGLFQYASVRSAAMRRCSCSASQLVGMAVRTRIRGT